MLHFESDYLAGACEEIMDALVKSNLERTKGYGSDDYSKKAKEDILKACDLEEGQVHFLLGGTQTNATVISCMLRSFEGIIAPTSAHIATHESGAIEYTGHKVLTLPETEGKISAQQIEDYLKAFYAQDTWAHCVIPGGVYITHPTEFGTLYTAKEMADIYALCQSYEIPLYVDGARLAYGLAGEGADIDLPFLAQHSDIFYIGGTKCGALFGEAVVSRHTKLLPQFFTSIKQHGALLAKGRLAGLQFGTLFADGLYLNLGKNAVAQALRIKETLKSRGYKMFKDSPTNQQFVILSHEKIKALSEDVGFEIWEPYDETHDVVRFVTSWSSTEEEIEAFLKLM